MTFVIPPATNPAIPRSQAINRNHVNPVPYVYGTLHIGHTPMHRIPCNLLQHMAKAPSAFAIHRTYRWTMTPVTYPRTTGQTYSSPARAPSSPCRAPSPSRLPLVAYALSNCPNRRFAWKPLATRGFHGGLLLASRQTLYASPVYGLSRILTCQQRRIIVVTTVTTMCLR